MGRMVQGPLRAAAGSGKVLHREIETRDTPKVEEYTGSANGKQLTVTVTTSRIGTAHARATFDLRRTLPCCNGNTRREQFRRE